MTYTRTKLFLYCLSTCYNMYTCAYVVLLLNYPYTLFTYFQHQRQLGIPRTVAMVHALMATCLLQIVVRGLGKIVASSFVQLSKLLATTNSRWTWNNTSNLDHTCTRQARTCTCKYMLADRCIIMYIWFPWVLSDGDSLGHQTNVVNQNWLSRWQCPFYHQRKCAC